MAAGIIILVLLSSIPIRWYLKRQKEGRRNSRNSADSHSRTSRNSRNTSLSAHGTGTPNADIFAMAMQPRKPDVIQYVMNKHGARSSASMQSRENSRNHSSNSTRKNSGSSMASRSSNTTNISKNVPSTQSDNTSNSLPPSLADKKSVFDSDVRSEAVESLEWAPEPDPEEESTSSLRMEGDKEMKTQTPDVDDDDGGIAGTESTAGIMGRAVSGISITSGDAVIVFEDDVEEFAPNNIRGIPNVEMHLQDVATYSSSDGERDMT